MSGDTISVSRPDLLPIHNIQVIYPRLPEREEVQPDELSQAIQDGFGGQAHPRRGSGGQAGDAE